MFSSLLFAVHLYAIAGVPIPLGVELSQAAKLEGVDRYDLAATLISEHHGAYDPRPSPTGAEGVWQLRPVWAEHWSEATGIKGDVHDPETRSRIAAWVIAYSQRRHLACSPGGHTWVAHWKCGPGGRDSCTGPQRRWERIRARL